MFIFFLFREVTSTRTMEENICPIVGQPEKLKLSLPTYEDLVKACQFERYKLLASSSKEPAFSSICDVVTNSIMEISMVPAKCHILKCLQCYLI